MRRFLGKLSLAADVSLKIARTFAEKQRHASIAIGPGQIWSFRVRCFDFVCDASTVMVNTGPLRGELRIKSMFLTLIAPSCSRSIPRSFSRRKIMMNLTAVRSDHLSVSVVSSRAGKHGLHELVKFSLMTMSEFVWNVLESSMGDGSVGQIGWAVPVGFSGQPCLASEDLR